MTEKRRDLPEAESADPDGVQVALRAAHTLWSHGDTAESLRWLSRAAESASDEGADRRSLELAKAAAELRARLIGSHPPGSSPVAGGQVGIPQAKQLHSARGQVSSPAAASASERVGVVPPGVEPSSGRAPHSQPPPLPAHRGRQSASAPAPGLLDGVGSHPANRPPGGELLSQYSGSVSTPPPVEPARSPVQDWLASAADSSPSHPLSSGPPPLPSASDGAARVEQQTIAIDSLDEDSAQHETQGAAAWDAAVRAAVSMPSDASSPFEAHSEASEQFAAPSEDRGSPPGTALRSPAEAAPESASARSKLTARVHHQAVRVAILADSLSAGQFIVRPLREGESAPEGARIALLVALEPGTPLV